MNTIKTLLIPFLLIVCLLVGCGKDDVKDHTTQESAQREAVYLMVHVNRLLSRARATEGPNTPPTKSELDELEQQLSSLTFDGDNEVIQLLTNCRDAHLECIRLERQSQGKAPVLGRPLHLLLITMRRLRIDGDRAKADGHPEIAEDIDGMLAFFDAMGTLGSDNERSR